MTPKNKIIETKLSMVQTSMAIYQYDRCATWSNYWFSRSNEDPIQFWCYICRL